MDNIFCSCCDYKFSIDEIYYDRFYICNNPNCYKILCSDCNDLNNVFLNDLSDIDCNCEDVNDGYNDSMSISTSPLSWDENYDVGRGDLTMNRYNYTESDEEKKDNDFIDFILTDDF